MYEMQFMANDFSKTYKCLIIDDPIPSLNILIIKFYLRYSWKQNCNK